MFMYCRRLALLLGCSWSVAAIAAENPSGAGQEAGQIEEVVVRASSILSSLGDAGSYTQLGEAEIADIGATHINEAIARVPGAWISRGSGQEHLTAIRSAVYTGSGACGEFAFLEDGIPIRPQGFCNVNNLFEVNSENAAAIEVWRGPASATLGGNALHGAINVLTPRPVPGLRVRAEGGPYGFYRAHVSAGQALTGALDGHEVGLSFVTTSSDGYRDDTGYDQQKLTLVHTAEIGGWSAKTRLTGTLLNQETGGFVQGFEAYDDGDLRDTNPNPESFRDAYALRLNSELTRDRWVLRPYLRHSDMRFLQHFLPGQPLEENSQTSAGMIALRSIDLSQVVTGFDLEAGGHIEYMTGDLREFQANPTTGSAFLVATRPPGLHYDYDVDSFMIAGFYNMSVDMGERTRLVHSLRVEHLQYDYTNNHIVGNTRDDGTPCGFGGCLYTRPASRDDDFTNVAARLGVEHEFAPGTWYATVSTGFRPPQVTELYRLRGGQTVADLDSEQLVSLETGIRGENWSAAIFSETTRNLLLRDSEAFNVSNGKTESWGVELDGTHTIGAHTWSLAASYAVHRYAFDREAEGLEIIQDGKMLDTAPRFLANARWAMELTESVRHELELVIVGPHYVNAANTAKYDGHGVVNWRGQWQVSEKFSVFARVINLLDERYADRADFAFGNYRYFPAMPRQVYLGVNVEI
jgi:outer membrane receptor protein involved in Fe transport